jgi:hypothetical protein
MRGRAEANAESFSWVVVADRPIAPAAGRKPSRARLDETRVASRRVAIACSLFLVFFGGTLLVGGRAAIGPLLRGADTPREANGVGDVVYAMPDGMFCRHVSFDNATATIGEGTMERCPGDIVRGRRNSAAAFAWGTH